MKRYNLSRIMSWAWKIFRKYAISFSEASVSSPSSVRIGVSSIVLMDTAKETAAITDSFEESV